MTPQQEITFWRRSYQQLLNTHNQFALQTGNLLGGPAVNIAAGGARGMSPTVSRPRSRSRSRSRSRTTTTTAAAR